MNNAYVHGYAPRESVRLQDQASTLLELLHSDTHYAAGSLVLEAGCGVGAQTLILSQNSPGARIVSLDISELSLREARRKLSGKADPAVSFLGGDLFALPFKAQSFDHLFVCFVLEHLSDPVRALQSLKTLLKPGGTFTIIEGDHGSVYFHPDNPAAHQAIQCQIELQSRSGGDACIGRRLYPLLRQAGFDTCRVSPRMVYVDSSRPEWVAGFTRNTFTAMIEGVRAKALEAGLMEPARFDLGIQGLYRTTREDGVFCYTFFKAIAQA